MSAVDIVTRLRKRHETEGWIDDPNVEVDAADEIERLRTLCDRLYMVLDAHYGEGNPMTDPTLLSVVAEYKGEPHANIRSLR
jgi:hypothetical protein